MITESLMFSLFLYSGAEYSFVLGVGQVWNNMYGGPYS